MDFIFLSVSPCIQPLSVVFWIALPGVMHSDELWKTVVLVLEDVQREQSVLVVSVVDR